MEYGLKCIFWEGTDSFVDLEYLMKIFEGSVWFYKIPFFLPSLLPYFPLDFSFHLKFYLLSTWNVPGIWYILLFCNWLLLKDLIHSHYLYPLKCVPAAQPSPLNPHLVQANIHGTSPCGCVIGILSLIFLQLNTCKDSEERSCSLESSNNKKSRVLRAK